MAAFLPVSRVNTRDELFIFTFLAREAYQC